MALEALENGVVLAIHGQERAAALARGGHHKLAGEHENFLRGERDGFLRCDGREGGLQSGGADHRDKNDVGFGEDRQFAQAGETAVKLGAGRKNGRRPGGVEGRFIVQRHVTHLKLAGDFGETGVVALGGDADEFQPVAVGGDDFERALSDGAGSAEENDATFVVYFRHGWERLAAR